MQFKLKSDKKEEPIIELSLEGNGEEVILDGRDNKGRTKHLMFFRNGRFYRDTSAELEGLKTDEKGRIVEEKEGL